MTPDVIRPSVDISDTFNWMMMPSVVISIEADEPTELAAIRELEEETGYKAERKNVKKLISVYTAVAFCNEIIDIYVADKLIRTCQNLDDEESINVEIYTLDEIKRMIFDGTIKDSKTVSAMMAYSDMISRI